STSRCTAPVFTLSLHDALPISSARARCSRPRSSGSTWGSDPIDLAVFDDGCWASPGRERGRGRDLDEQDPTLLISGRDPSNLDRSEEHTSELQSRENLVCRLLL